MRASRVISMLLALQQRGQMTAAQLAAELEVSQRTVLRDVETLSGAGIPIYATQGAGGGIRLLEGFTPARAAMTAGDASGLLLAGQPELASLLGLGVVAATARRSLLATLPPPLASSATSVERWFMHDPAGRRGLPFDPELLRLAARAVQQHLELRRPAGPPLLPLGLVLSAGHWQLVHLDGRPQALALVSLRGPITLGRSFTRPEDFDLQHFWRSLE